jgi:hypothetical protein
VREETPPPSKLKSNTSLRYGAILLLKYRRLYCFCHVILHKMRIVFEFILFFRCNLILNFILLLRRTSCSTHVSTQHWSSSGICNNCWWNCCASVRKFNFWGMNIYNSYTRHSKRN